VSTYSFTYSVASTNRVAITNEISSIYNKRDICTSEVSRSRGLGSKRGWAVGAVGRGRVERDRRARAGFSGRILGQDSRAGLGTRMQIRTRGAFGRAGGG
jgi:hypothetical protein